MNLMNFLNLIFLKIEPQIILSYHSIFGSFLNQESSSFWLPNTILEYGVSWQIKQ